MQQLLLFFSVLCTFLTPLLCPLYILNSNYYYSFSLSFVHLQQLLLFFFSIFVHFSPAVTTVPLLYSLFICSNCYCSSSLFFVHFHQQLLPFLFSKQKALLFYPLFICSSCYCYFLKPLYILISSFLSFVHLQQQLMLLLFSILCSFAATTTPLFYLLFIFTNSYCHPFYFSFCQNHQQLLLPFSLFFVHLQLLLLSFYSSLAMMLLLLTPIHI